jgi:medium-chain acyl-[acyl-carrier-protein] hydrolase
MAATVSPWFPLRQPNPRARLRLFCFPYAGGSASAFRCWGAALPPEVELCALQLPGRERRLSEPPFSQLTALLEALEPAMLPLLDRPFAFFGYSMGTRIALALAQRWQARQAPQPRVLIAAAASAPHLPRSTPPLHELDDAGLREALRRYEGTPAEVLEHRELMELLLPLLRADFTIAGTLLPPEPLRCPISAWGGLEDANVPLEGLERWRELTQAEFRLRRFPGGHFFLRDAGELLLVALREELARL